MEIILIQPVKGLGSIGQITKVKDGFGRNYLIPQGKAIRATESNRKLFESKRNEIEQRNHEAKTVAAELSKSLNGQVFSFIRQAGSDGRLYGSVNAKELARNMSEKFQDIKYTQILLHEPIKTIGLHKVEIALHSEVVDTIYVNIARTDSEAQEVLRNHMQQQAPKAAEDTAATAA